MIDYGINQKNAIVCGSSLGLGYACANSLLKAGVNVTINGRDPDKLNNACESLTPTAESSGASITQVAADVTTADGQKSLLAACPSPDIMVTNAAGPPFKNFIELDRQAMVDGLGMNMITPIELIQQVIDAMVQRQFGRIVNITSISVKMPVSGLDLSSGARAGLTSFLAGVSRDYAHANVTINNLLPGYFDTQRFRAGVKAWADAQGQDEESVAKMRAEEIPAKRVGNPAEFGDACAFLCSASAGYITGQNLLMDGGLFKSAF